MRRLSLSLVGLVTALGVAAVVLSASPAQATAEVEPNDDEGSANAAVAGAASSGVVAASDTDFWSYAAATTGWLRVAYTVDAGLDFTVVPAGGTPSYLTTSSAQIRVFNVTGGDTTHFAVNSSTSATGAYSFELLFGQNASMFSEGAGETEPNDDAAHATLLSAGGSFAGAGDDGVDPADFFRVDGQAGDYISLTVTKDFGETGALSVTPVTGAVNWTGGVTRSAVVLLAADSQIVFRVSASGFEFNYTIGFVKDHTDAYADGVLNLTEAYDDLLIDAYIFPSRDPPSGSQGVNLRTGGGLMFGETLCIETSLDTDVYGLVLAAGQIVEPSGTELQRMVVSRNATLTIPAGGEACFRAMSYDEEGLIGSTFDLYSPGDWLMGNASKVMAVINANQSDDAGGQLALWAVTSGTTESRALLWSATPTILAEARAILNEAGVNTPLNPASAPPPPLPPPPGGTGGTSTAPSSGLPLALLVGVAILGLVVVGALAARARSRKALQGAVPPLPGYPAGQGLPGVPGQAPPYGPPGAAAAAPPPYGAYGAPAAPPSTPPAAYAPPAYTGAPAPPPAAYAPPAYAPPAYAAAPAPPAPAAPAGTTPCPQCGQPVAFYAPQCGRCGMAFNWS